MMARPGMKLPGGTGMIPAPHLLLLSTPYRTTRRRGWKSFPTDRSGPTRRLGGIRRSNRPTARAHPTLARPRAPTSLGTNLGPGIRHDAERASMAWRMYATEE